MRENNEVTGSQLFQSKLFQLKQVLDTPIPKYKCYVLCIKGAALPYIYHATRRSYAVRNF